MIIIFSTIPRAYPQIRVYFEAPDDALLVRVVEKVTEQIGQHLNYVFHDKAPDGATPIFLEDVGPPATTTPLDETTDSPDETTVVNNLRAASAESWAACRQALRDADGDYDQALELLRIRAARRDMGRF